MNRIIFLTIGIFSLFFLGGCVENSAKYKALQAQMDSLNNESSNLNAEMENMLADLNDISAGMKSIREAENILSVESASQAESGKTNRNEIIQLKNDVQAISSDINSYKEQIAKLEDKNKKQSAEFKKLIAGLNEELENKIQKIAEISAQLAEKEKQLGIKTQQIEVLNQNVASLNQESAGQKSTIAQQDQAINTVNYLIGSKKELKESNVISRQGLFCPPIVSSQAQQAKFITVDMREAKNIPLNTKKVKILSVHATESYTLEAGEDGNLTLQINDPETFWKQTKYLVVMVG